MVYFRNRRKDSSFTTTSEQLCAITKKVPPEKRRDCPIFYNCPLNVAVAGIVVCPPSSQIPPFFFFLVRSMTHPTLISTPLPRKCRNKRKSTLLNISNKKCCLSPSFFSLLICGIKAVWGGLLSPPFLKI